MLVVIKQGGLGSGGLNFDAKLRRGSTDSLDLFYAHIGGIDTFARGLLIAQKIIDDGLVEEFINQRYTSYDSDLGKRIMIGDTDFDQLEAWVLEKGEPHPISGRQEFLENLINSYL
jgi:xylose isomerase